RRIELLKHFQRRRDHFHRDCGHGEIAAGRLDLLRIFLAELFEPGDVREVALRDVRNRLPRNAEVLGGLAADGAHRLTLDLAPARKIRQRLRGRAAALDRKSTRLNSSHVSISYAVFCLKKKNKTTFYGFTYISMQTPPLRQL